MCRRHVAGYSLLELVFALGLIVTAAGAALPGLQATLNDTRAAGAARYMVTRLQRARMEAVSRSANVAIQFLRTESGYAYATFADGNGNGVRTQDIRDGIDRPLSVLERLPDNFPGVEFGLLSGL